MWTRRDVLYWFGVAGAAAACGGSKHDAPAPAKDRWAVLAEILAAVRGSPDHLIARADDAVRSKDPQQIAAFVRRIAVIPVRGDGAVAEVRWGTRATLRGGLGTPRELAELLVELLNRAGAKATVAQATIPAAEIEAAYARTLVASDAPLADDETLARWFAVLGPAPKHPPVAALPAGDLAQQLLPLVPASVDSGTLAPLPTRMPVAQLANGTVLNPFGPSTPTDATALAGAPPYLRATVQLLYTTTDDPYRLRLAVEGDWGLDELVGRRVGVHFQPLLPPAAWIEATPASVPAWTPMLTLHGPDLDRDAAAKAAKTGVAIQADGTPIAVVDGKVVIGGRVVPTGKPDPAQLAKVVSATLAIDASTFPQVSARLVLLDAAGAPVTGLSARAFSLVEDGAHQPAIVAGPEAPTPRIAILFDGSTSMPDEFRLADRRAALARAIADKVKATLRVGGIDAGNAVWAGDWTTDPAALEANARTITAAGDQLWGAYASAVKAGATLVAIVSDGLSTDEPGSLAEPIIRTGPPCIALAVADAGAGIFPQLTARTGGRAAAVAKQAEAVDAIAALVGSPAALPYAITWPAGAGKPTREVSVQLLGLKVRATATYSVPATPAPPLRLAGLYLSCAFSYEPPVMRRIAGKAIGVGGRVVTPEETADAFAALMGVEWLSFEGGAPPLPHWCDEGIAHALALRPLQEAVAKKDGAAARALIEGGTLTPAAPLMLAALHAELGPVVPVRARVVRLSNRLRPGDAKTLKVSRGVDLLGNTRFAARTGDRAARLAAVLAASERLARVEGALSTHSTWHELAGAKLAVVDAAKLDPKMAQYWDHQILVAGDRRTAAWAIDPQTGSTLGAIADGSGGAREDICRVLHDAQQMLAVIGALGSGLGFSFAFGVFLSLAKVEMTLVLESAIAIARLEDGSNADPLPDVNRAFLDLGCDLGSGGLGEALGPDGTLGAFGPQLWGYINAYNDLRASHNRSSFSCSNALFGDAPSSCG